MYLYPHWLFKSFSVILLPKITVGNTAVEKLNTEISISNTTLEENSITNEIRIGASETQTRLEEDLATFSTKLGGKDTPRSRNIAITSSLLNETIVKNGETFSFCDTIRKTYR